MNYFYEFFSGRIGRLAYFFGTLYYCLAFGIPFLVLSVGYITVLPYFVYHPAQNLIQKPTVVLVIILYALLIFASLSLAARRMNDVERPTWFCLLSIIPFVNIPFTIYMLFAPGTQDNNSSGAASSSLNFWSVTKLKPSTNKSADK